MRSKRDELFKFQQKKCFEVSCSLSQVECFVKPGAESRQSKCRSASTSPRWPARPCRPPQTQRPRPPRPPRRPWIRPRRPPKLPHPRWRRQRACPSQLREALRRQLRLLQHRGPLLPRPLLPDLQHLELSPLNRLHSREHPRRHRSSNSHGCERLLLKPCSLLLRPLFHSPRLSSRRQHSLHRCLQL